MRLIKWLKSRFKQASPVAKAASQSIAIDSLDRLAHLESKIARLERNYVVLLKRMLELDGVKLQVPTSKTQVFNNKVLATADDKGFNDRKPTIH